MLDLLAACKRAARATREAELVSPPHRPPAIDRAQRERERGREQHYVAAPHNIALLQLDVKSTPLTQERGGPSL